MTKKMLALVGIALVLVIGWLVFLFFPENNQQARLQADIASAQSQLQDYEVTLAQLPAFMQAQAKLRDQLSQVNSHLYAKQDLKLLFAELERTANAHGLRVVEITPPVSELVELNRMNPDGGEPQFLSLTIVLRGSYLNFGNYVEQLENTPYFRSVQSCVIQRLQDDSQQLTYSLGFKALLGVTLEELS